ncbi:YkvA family protein [Deinococcus sp.]|uniref:YkvA family protein n=1 Tax=Deinococcus sp. TaxID=47478 RepID=UPI003CC5817E
MTRITSPSRRPPGVFGRFVPARLRSVWFDALSLLMALPDRRTPPLSRLIALAALVYAVSPIDLLPDSIPVLGVSDDLLIVPALLAFAARSLPSAVLAEARFKADRFAAHRRWLVPAVLGGVLLIGLGLAYLLVRGVGALFGG